MGPERGKSCNLGREKRWRTRSVTQTDDRHGKLRENTPRWEKLSYPGQDHLRGFASQRNRGRTASSRTEKKLQAGNMGAKSRKKKSTKREERRGKENKRRNDSKRIISEAGGRWTDQLGRDHRKRLQN